MVYASTGRLCAGGACCVHEMRGITINTRNRIRLRQWKNCRSFISTPVLEAIPPGKLIPFGSRDLVAAAVVAARNKFDSSLMASPNFVESERLPKLSLGGCELYHSSGR